MDGRPAYRIQLSLVRRVRRDLLVSIESNLYSVPAPYVGTWVEVQAGPEDTIEIYHRGVVIARHRRVVDLEHYRGLLLERKAREIGEALTPFPTLWRVIEPEVEVRDLAVYEAVASGEWSEPLKLDRES